MSDEKAKPLVRVVQYLFAFFLFPVLVGIAWSKAIIFDPYTMTMFPVKVYVEPTANTPSDLRLLGGFLIALGGGLAALAVLGSKKSTTALKDVWMVIWIGVMVAAYGASFFVAADRASDRIAEETAGETGTT